MSLDHSDPNSLAWLFGITLDDIVETSDWLSRSLSSEKQIARDIVEVDLMYVEGVEAIKTKYNDKQCLFNMLGKRHGG